MGDDDTKGASPGSESGGHEGNGEARKLPNAHLFERLHRLDGLGTDGEGDARELGIDDAISRAEEAFERRRDELADLFRAACDASDERAAKRRGDEAREGEEQPKEPAGGAVRPQPTEWERLWMDMEEREAARRDAEERAGEGDETAALGAWEEEGKPRHPIDALIADMDDAWNESLEEAVREGALAERARLLRFARIYSAVRAWWRMHGDREGGGDGKA